MTMTRRSMPAVLFLLFLLGSAHAKETMETKSDHGADLVRSSSEDKNSASLKGDLVNNDISFDVYTNDKWYRDRRYRPRGLNCRFFTVNRWVSRRLNARTCRSLQRLGMKQKAAHDRRAGGCVRPRYSTRDRRRCRYFHKNRWVTRYTSSTFCAYYQCQGRKEKAAHDRRKTGGCVRPRYSTRDRRRCRYFHKNRWVTRYTSSTFCAYYSCQGRKEKAAHDRRKTGGCVRPRYGTRDRRRCRYFRKNRWATMFTSSTFCAYYQCQGRKEKAAHDRRKTGGCVRPRYSTRDRRRCRYFHKNRWVTKAKGCS
eukprot:TRINITY_DN654_c0_g1_i3.p1 TRINITY_DN654_c0_g1~~TRINITY_DN654_c0_g1_i3.p1  ORF type:complete len:310 (+),score=-14.20 TRINITY_DN654_c0_g1_i3:62-991(+)